MSMTEEDEEFAGKMAFLIREHQKRDVEARLELLDEDRKMLDMLSFIKSKADLRKLKETLEQDLDPEEREVLENDVRLFNEYVRNNFTTDYH